QIPFEFRATFLGLSNLQWTFILLILVSIPDLFANWKVRLSDRFVWATAIFVATQWLATLYAPAFQTNVLKAAVRFTAGFLLVFLTCRPIPTRIWAVASAAAAFYALADYVGLGWPALFRTEEFYIGQVHRLSGSFEYPNTAVAYFAMSLPLAWW